MVCCGTAFLPLSATCSAIPVSLATFAGLSTRGYGIVYPIHIDRNWLFDSP